MGQGGIWQRGYEAPQGLAHADLGGTTEENKAYHIAATAAGHSKGRGTDEATLLVSGCLLQVLGHPLEVIEQVHGDAGVGTVAVPQVLLHPAGIHP